MVTAVVTSGNDVSSQQRQWWGQATAAETEAAAGAHSNQPTNVTNISIISFRGSGNESDGRICGGADGGNINGDSDA